MGVEYRTLSIDRVIHEVQEDVRWLGFPRTYRVHGKGNSYHELLCLTS